jgi:hypothetical protein
MPARGTDLNNQTASLAGIERSRSHTLTTEFHHGREVIVHEGLYVLITTPRSKLKRSQTCLKSAGLCHRADVHSPTSMICYQTLTIGQHTDADRLSLRSPYADGHDDPGSEWSAFIHKDCTMPSPARQAGSVIQSPLAHCAVTK